MQRTIFFCGRSIPSQKRTGSHIFDVHKVCSARFYFSRTLTLKACLSTAPSGRNCQVMGWCGCCFFTRCMNPMKGHKISDSDCQMTPKKMRVPQFATNHNRLYNSTSPKSIQYMTLGPQRFREETKASYFIKEEPNINPPFIPKATLSPKWSNYQLSFSAWKQTKTTTQHSLSFFRSVWFCVVLWVPCFLFFFFSSSSSSSIFLFSSFPPFFLFPFFFFSPASYFSIPSPPSFLLLLLPPTFLLLPFVLFFCFFLSFLFVFCCART